MIKHDDASDTPHVKLQHSKHPEAVVRGIARRRDSESDSSSFHLQASVTGLLLLNWSDLNAYELFCLCAWFLRAEEDSDHYVAEPCDPPTNASWGVPEGV